MVSLRWGGHQQITVIPGQAGWQGSESPDRPKVRKAHEGATPTPRRVRQLQREDQDSTDAACSCGPVDPVHPVGRWDEGGGSWEWRNQGMYRVPRMAPQVGHPRAWCERNAHCSRCVPATWGLEYADRHPALQFVARNRPLPNPHGGLVPPRARECPLGRVHSVPRDSAPATANLRRISGPPQCCRQPPWVLPRTVLGTRGEDQGLGVDANTSSISMDPICGGLGQPGWIGVRKRRSVGNVDICLR